MTAQDTRLADDGAGAMIHKKMCSNLRARMQIHPGAAMRPLGHDAWNKWNVFEIQLMGKPLDGDGLDKWIGQNDLLFAERGGVAIKGCLSVGLEQFTDARQAGQKFDCQRMGAGTQVFFG